MIFPFFIIYLYICIVRPHLWRMEFPRLGAELELHLLGYAIATWDPSHVCDLHSSQQRQILNPLRKARDRTHILMDASLVHYP